MRSLFCAATILSALCTSAATATDKPLVEKYLYTGKLAQGENALREHVEEHPDDHQAAFGLGVVRFLQAIEHLGQSNYRYGLLQHRARFMPFLRLPIPMNDNPEELSYELAREELQQLIDDLAKAERTLAEVATADVKLPLHFGRIRLDLNGDGKVSEEEELWKIYTIVNRRVDRESGRNFKIAFDGGDVHWLRGYCHLLMALGEFGLAYDWREPFERCGHLFFPRVKSPHTFLAEEDYAPGLEFRPIADAVSFVHLINLPVVEPDRAAKALEHLHAVIGQSRLSWERILAETDNDREWLPNPNQASVIPNVRVGRDMVAGWHDFLNEAEALLSGKKLIPFWRGAKSPDGPTRGVNLKRVFTEPRDFDLILWVAGTGATPYLERGEYSTSETWMRLLGIFRGNFVGFALWFN